MRRGMKDDPAILGGEIEQLYRELHEAALAFDDDEVKKIRREIAVLEREFNKNWREDYE